MAGPSCPDQSREFLVRKTDGVAKRFRREAPSSNLFASGSEKSLLMGQFPGASASSTACGRIGKMTDARTRGGKDRISNRRCNRRSRRFTKPNWCFRTWQKLHLDFRYVSHAQQAIGVKVGIFRLAFHELRSLVQGHAQSPQRAAFHLGFRAVGMNDGAGVNDQRQLLYRYVAGSCGHMHASGAGCPGGHAAFLAERGCNAEPDIFRCRLAPSRLLRHAGEHGRLAVRAADGIRRRSGISSCSVEQL